MTNRMVRWHISRESRQEKMRLMIDSREKVGPWLEGNTVWPSVLSPAADVCARTDRECEEHRIPQGGVWKRQTPAVET